MCRKKPKLLNHKIRGMKKLQMSLHIKVYRKEERNFTAVHLFDSAKFV